MKYTLTNDEYNVLNRIASETKMDCWFWLCTDGHEHDVVFDLEEYKMLDLRTGVMMLNEGIVWELLDLTAEEIAVYKNLLKELGIDDDDDFYADLLMEQREQM